MQKNSPAAKPARSIRRPSERHVTWGVVAAPPPPRWVSVKFAKEHVNSPKIVDRWLYWSRPGRVPPGQIPWLKIVRAGGRGASTLITYRSLAQACERMENGEEPPRLPSERREPN